MKDNNISKGTILALIMLLPFVVFTAIAFIPWWLSTPIAILGALFWAGSVLYLPEAK